jgi:hypothetical protein
MRCHPSDYKDRIYRRRTVNNNLIYYNVIVCNSDLYIGSDSDLTPIAYRSVLQHRTSIETYASLHHNFLTSLTPLIYDDFAPDIVREMLTASILTGVGPMASVAGAVAEYVGRDLEYYSKNVIVENGGDLYLRTIHDLQVGIFAAASPWSERLALLIKREEMPLGVCTSSASVGHSLSFGCADAVCVKAKSAILADAAATALGNQIQANIPIRPVLEKGMKIKDVLGVLVIVGDHIGAIGDIELAER